MKKTIGTYFVRYFKMPHLFRNDLETIEKIIQTELKPKRYLLACNGLEYKDLEDIPTYTKSTNVLVIYTHSPCMRLKLTRSWAELYSGDDGEGVDDAVRLIAAVVAKSQRRGLWALYKFSAWLAPMVGFGSMTIIMGLIMLGMLSPRALYVASWILLMASVWWAAGHFFMLHNFSQIEFHSTRKNSYLHRHQVSILIFLMGSLVGGATLFLLSKFFQLP